MTFAKTLESYLAELDCPASALALASGVSSATISRYRMGTRIPDRDNESLDKLADGICAIGSKTGSPRSREEVLAALRDAADDPSANDAALSNVDTLLTTLDVRNTELARALNYDPSYLSRIRSGQRRPSDVEAFLERVCEFAARRITGHPGSAALVSGLLGNASPSPDADVLAGQLLEWTHSSRSEPERPADRFVEALSSFDLDEFIRAIRFDELQAPPTLPVSIPREKRYQGTEGLRQGEMDFLHATLLSPKNDPVLFYSDMDMEDLANNMAFSKKWMGGIALLLKRGLHMDLIHDVNRPVGEMMLGLEVWIPLYMTGQIFPHYLPDANSSAFCHGLRTSGDAALSGEGIRGHREHDRYLFTTKKQEVAYLRQRGHDLLELAQPLMQIYREDAQDRFRSFVQTQAQQPGRIRRVLSTPPIYTIATETLDGLLEARNVAPADASAIRSYVERMRTYVADLQEHDLLFDEFPVLGRDEFDERPVLLPLSGMFANVEVPYTYDAYRQHVESTLEAAAHRRNYEAAADLASAFRNIQITVRPGKWATVSKDKSPTIHFVIWHPKLVDALEHIEPPVFE